MAVEAAVDSMKNGTKQMARRQLGALALLAESGVPTRWLDPTIDQQDDWKLQGTNPAEDEDAHDALTELIHRSIVQQSTDGSTIMLHRLQARTIREEWIETQEGGPLRSRSILFDYCQRSSHLGVLVQTTGITSVSIVATIWKYSERVRIPILMNCIQSRRKCWDRFEMAWYRYQISASSKQKLRVTKNEIHRTTTTQSPSKSTPGLNSTSRCSKSPFRYPRRH